MRMDAPDFVFVNVITNVFIYVLASLLTGVDAHVGLITNMLANAQLHMLM